MHTCRHTGQSGLHNLVVETPVEKWGAARFSRGN